MATSTPNWSGYLDGVWAWPIESCGLLPLLAGASNIVVGQNPPYTIQDFLGFYPKWGGTPLPLGAATVSASAEVILDDASGVAVGNYLAGPGIPDGAFIQAIDPDTSTITMNLNATATGTEVAIQAWTAPLIPFAIINAYIYVASSSLVQNRWQELWAFAMALYVAHFLTLYARSDGGDWKPSCARPPRREGADCHRARPRSATPVRP